MLRVWTLFLIVVFSICSTQRAKAENFFHFSRPELALEFSYESFQEKREGSNIDSKDTSYSFYERFRLETTGWVYHPALFEFTLGLEPAWIQTTQEHSTDIASTSNDIKYDYLSYSLDASVFQFKPYTLNFYASQYDNDTTSAYAQRTKILTTTYGGNLLLTYRTLPTTVSYLHSDSQEEGFYNSTTREDGLRLNMHLPKKNNDTEFDVSLVDKTQNTNGVQTDIETLNGKLYNQLIFSQELRRHLISTLYYRQTDGSFFNNTGITFDQNFDWEHTETLSSNYHARYDRNESDTSESEKGALVAGLTYDITDHLETRISSNASYGKYEGGKEQVLGAGIDFEYNKDTPIGNLRLTSFHNYSSRNRDVTQSMVPSINEPHTLSDTDLTYLDQKDIDADSIVVTDSDGTTLYIENIDYVLTEQSPYLRITRIPFGSIPDGGTVLVSYQYKNPYDFDDAIFSQAYGFTYTPFESLSFFYRYAQIDQIYRGGVSPETLDHSVVQRGEVIWDVKFSRTRLSYLDSNENSGNSYTRWYAEETLSYRPMRSLFLMLSATYGETEFKKTHDNETFYLIRSEIDYSPSRFWEFSIESFNNNISGDSVDTTDQGVLVRLNMYYGVWSGKIEYSYLNQEDRRFGESRENNSITFEILRKLW